MTVSILGIASAVPENLSYPSQFDDFARKWVKPSAPLDKTIYVNSRTGILHRPSLQTDISPILNRPNPAAIQEIVSTFLQVGLSLAETASKKAIADWGQSTSSITHLICTTCTASSHPGYDLYLHQALGLNSSVERTLIHGIGCAGGLSILRLARNICIAAESLGRKVRILVVALEVTSTLLRTELEALDEEAERGGGKPNVAATIFSDAASALIVGNGELEDDEHSSFEVLECLAETVSHTSEDLAFDIHEKGWRAIISPRVPDLTSKSVPPLFNRLTFLASSSSRSHSLPILSTTNPPEAAKFDWFIHTGGSLIISTLSKNLGLLSPNDDPTQTTASWQMYKERGNASSASIGGVIERGRKLGGREGVIAVAFGPGVTVEMCMLKRLEWRGREVVSQVNGVIGTSSIVINGNGNADQPLSMVKANGNGYTMSDGGTIQVKKSTDATPSPSLRTIKYCLGQGHGAGRSDVSKCICTTRVSMFGGSGYDCWCRS